MHQDVKKLAPSLTDSKHRGGHANPGGLAAGATDLAAVAFSSLFQSDSIFTWER